MFILSILSDSSIVIESIKFTKQKKKKKERGGKREGSKFAKKKRGTSRGDERCAVKGSFKGNGYEYKE